MKHGGNLIVNQGLSRLILARMSSQKVWWLVAGALGLAVIWTMMSRADYAGTYGSPTPTAKAATATPRAGATKTPTSQSTVSYTQALQTYGSNRIQFDQYCQGQPSSMSLKTGSKIMLDNRSGDARTIVVDGKKYNLAGYGFQVITLSSKTLPYTVKVDCGTSKNVAQVFLQATIGQ
ncbi:MAG: hypothetical protein KW806_03300 [Candidatus Yanofskybacteria bacterium]|nr:hypothetical protein [Candidatus Yanofskybacteria bacterium]